ncbi:MAG: HigA family addiction module antidote protein [Planctomycetes bacterium]|nr:HigA family addiction module antidote protein [Planctomycetota bacterium]
MAKMKPAHPGLVLQDELDELGISQRDLAARLRVDASRINDICRGRRGISPEMAIKLDRALGGTPEFWMNLQIQWELSQFDNREYNFIEQITGNKWRSMQ